MLSRPKVDYDLKSFTLKGDDLDKFCDKYNNLVFEGGGIRGIAFGGVLKFFEEHDLMKYIKRVAGSSAGAIVAAGVALGYNGQEIINILDKTNFNEFKDDSWGVVLDVYRFFTQYGIYKGDKFLDWFKALVKEKTGDENTTFKQIYDERGVELVITGTCLNRGITYYFEHRKWPDMPIALAVRISMSIPLIFKSIKLHTKEPDMDKDGNINTDKDGNPIMIDREDIMVDGGLLDNYPIWIFDGKTIGDDDVNEEDMKNSKTLGFKLMSSNEKQDDQIYHYYEPINNIVDYTKAFIDSMTIQIERGHVRKGYWDKTVSINTGDIHTLDFDLPRETKDLLIHNAYEATKNHFYCCLHDIPNEWNRIL